MNLKKIGQKSKLILKTLNNSNLKMFQTKRKCEEASNKIIVNLLAGYKMNLH